MSCSEDEFLDGDVEAMEATFDRSLGLEDGLVG